MNTSDLRTDSAIFALLKGEPGTGKSIAAHSWAENSYTFDFDNKMKAVTNYYRNKSFEYDTFDDIFEAHKKLEEFKISCPYQTLIWDGWSSFARLALKSMLGVRKPGAKRIMKGNIERYQIEDYGGEERAIDTALGDLKVINVKHNVNVISVCHIIHTVTHDIVRNVDIDYQSLYIPGGKIAFAVPIPFDELWKFSVEISMETGEPEYIVTTRNASTDICKTALRLPSRISWTKNENLKDKIMLLHNSAL